MKKYILATLFLAMSLMLVLVVAGFEFKPIDSLMRPPVVDGENREIQLAFEDFAGDGYQLISPLKGDHRSAYNFFDLNNDSQDEVIVFYSKADDNELVRLNVLGKKKDGQWISLVDIETGHSDVQQVEFADLNGDTIKELIVGWTVYQNEFTKTMNVYAITEKNTKYVFESIYSSSYYDFKIFDVNCDNVKDVLKIDFEKTPDGTDYKAVLLGYKDKTLTDITSANLDMSFSSITSVTSDYSKEENKRRLYFDGPKYESGMITDCIYLDNDGVFRKERTAYPLLSVWSTRNSNIVSKDVNNDGIIEIPKEEEIPASDIIYDGNNEIQKQYIIKWTQIDENVESTVCHEIFNSYFGYSYKIDETLTDKVAVTNNLRTGVLTFYALNTTYGTPHKGDALFSILAIKEGESGDDVIFRYKNLDENNTHHFYYRIYEAGESYGITKLTIRKNFSFN